MKKFGWAFVILSAWLSAGGTSQVKTMQELESALAKVQQGLMYNNKAMLRKGTTQLKKAAKHIKSFQIPSQREGFDPKAFAKNESIALSKLADQLVSDFDKHDKNAVLSTYSKMQNQCITCHELVRKW